MTSNITNTTSIGDDDKMDDNDDDSKLPPCIYFDKSVT